MACFPLALLKKRILPHLYQCLSSCFSDGSLAEALLHVHVNKYSKFKHILKRRLIIKSNFLLREEKADVCLARTECLQVRSHNAAAFFCKYI